MSSAKTCLACGDPVKGRSDKKFCNDYCRNSYNNQLKEAPRGLVRRVNAILAKNRRILESLFKSSLEQSLTVKISREKLMLLGFHFTYFTHTYTNKAGKTYFYCYDYGYLPLENTWCLIVKKRDDKKNPPLPAGYYKS